MTTPPIPSDEHLDKILKQYSTHVQHGHAEIGLPVAKEAIQIYFDARQKAAVETAVALSNADIAWLCGKLRGLGYPAENIEQKYGLRPTESVEGEGVC